MEKAKKEAEENFEKMIGLQEKEMQLQKEECKEQRKNGHKGVG